MISFFGLSNILSKKNLWTNEKEHSAIIKKVKIASSCNLPKHILDTVFPLGWKCPKDNYAKGEFSRKIKDTYPLPLPISQDLQDMSEQEMRTYIEKLDSALQRQFDGCLELLYGINYTDENFSEIKQIFSKKFMIASRQEMLIVFVTLVLFFLDIVALLFILITETTISDNIYLLFCLPYIVLLLFLGIYAFYRINYFKINKNKPTL